MGLLAAGIFALGGVPLAAGSGMEPTQDGAAVCLIAVRTDVLTRLNFPWPKIGNRKAGVVAASILKPRHYLAAANMLWVYRHRWDAFERYLLGWGEYPAEIELNTTSGPLWLMAYSHHDILTINEIFCRLDYRSNGREHIIVDFGSNIGISAAYFLTASPASFAYLFEPLQLNVARLRRNLHRFEDRYVLHEVAVGPAEGEVKFGWEETGRYGGVGRDTGNYVSVTCLDSNRVLSEIVARHGRIDILKVDVESLEKQIIERIPLTLAREIGTIYAEHPFAQNPLRMTHTHRQYGIIAQFARRA